MQTSRLPSERVEVVSSLRHDVSDLENVDRLRAERDDGNDGISQDVEVGGENVTAESGPC